ncbi:hypothetical protein [Photobacterium damselae]|uniref:hypothetical protein n=1 Tax=Photobacterium damselae TaxID=38293 RepID=UPI001302185C|nr:hypothetical protein [Photobacterium damselae]
MQYGVASTTENIAHIYVRVTEDGTANKPVEGVEVSIESSDGNVKFSTDGLSWSKKAVCTTAVTGNCSLKLAVTKAGLMIAPFHVSIAGSGATSSVDDYVNYNAVLSHVEGSFDRQRDSDGVWDRPDAKMCSFFYHNYNPGSTIDTLFSNSFAPVFEKEPSSSGLSRFKCLNGTDEIDGNLSSSFPYEDRACVGLMVVAFDLPDKCIGAPFYEAAPEANSTYAQTGSGDRFDGDDRALLMRPIQASSNAPVGFNIVIKREDVPSSASTLEIDYDLYVIGKTMSGGYDIDHTDTKSKFSIGLYEGLNSNTPINSSAISEQIYNIGDTSKTKRWIHHNSSISLQNYMNTKLLYIRFEAKGIGSDGTSILNGLYLVDNVKYTYR